MKLANILKNAKKSNIALFEPIIIEAMGHYGIDTPLRQAHFLAQIGHESGELNYREEIASGEAYEGRKDLGNTQRGDGKKFKGRGLIQLTGRANYQKFATYLSRQELIQKPDKIATDTQLCVDVAAWFWMTHSLNQLADDDAIKSITRKINGGLNGLDNRVRLLALAKKELGI